MGDCQGACQRHCYCSVAVAGLAYVALTYMLACIAYLLVVRFGRVDSPFARSLSPAQQAIKRQSAATRARVFWACVAASVLLLVATRPLRADYRRRE